MGEPIHKRLHSEGSLKEVHLYDDEEEQEKVTILAPRLSVSSRNLTTEEEEPKEINYKTLRSLHSLTSLNRQVIWMINQTLMYNCSFAGGCCRGTKCYKSAD
jgi:hypothetical protein